MCIILPNDNGESIQVDLVRCLDLEKKGQERDK